MMQPIILFADNDPDFLKTRSEFLEQAGYQVIPATQPAEAKRVIEQGQVDLAVLDLRLINDDDEKDLSGLNVAKESQPSIPKIVLTRFPTGKAVRKILGSTLNNLPPAVDFIAKQEGPQALLTAIRKALVPRPNSSEARSVDQDIDQTTETSAFVIDYANKTVRIQGKVVELTKFQFKLLTYLYENRERVCSRDELLNHLYQEEEFEREDSALDAHITRLRKKIEPDPTNPRYIITIPGHGYKFGE